MAEITADAIEDLKKAYKEVHYVEPLPVGVDQVGSTCGIYALDTALRNRGIKAPPPRKLAKSVGGPPPPPPTKTGKGSLREMAKHAGLTKIGELFSSIEVLTLASLSGAPEAAIHGFSNTAELWSLVGDAAAKKRTILFPFCVDNSIKDDSRPKFDGKNPHWCLLIGCFKDPGAERVLSTQYGKYYDWSMADLVASNLTLLKWAAQDWGRLVVSRFEGATKSWKVVYNSWSNKTTPPDWLAKWEKAALLKPAEFKVEWTKTASFGEVDFSTTLKGQCVMV